MFTWTAKKGYAQDIATILDTVGTQELKTYKILRLTNKISEKCHNSLEDITRVQEELNDAMEPFRERMKGLTENEKKMIDEESRPAAQEFVNRLNEIREEEIEIELSNDEHDFLSNSFMKVIVPQIRSARYAYSIGESLGVEEEEGEKKE